MARLLREITFLAMLCVVRGDYSCVCNYDEENQIYSKPDSQSNEIDTLYEFDCKPAYGGYSGNGFAAIQIGGKIGYVDSQTNIQLQTCSGDASPFDLFTTTTPLSTAATTTKLSEAAVTTQMPIVSVTTQMPITSFTTDIEKAATTTQMPTVARTTPMPLVATTQMPMVATTTQRTTVRTTAQMPTASTTIRMPAAATTTKMQKEFTTAERPVSTTMQMKTTQSISNLMTTSIVAPSTLSYHRINISNNVLQYIGLSYNLTNGNPLSGADTASAPDPGLLIGKQVFELNEYLNGTSREVEIMNLTRTCNTQYALIHNGKSYQEELFTMIRPTGHSQQLVDSAFIFDKDTNLRTESPESGFDYPCSIMPAFIINMKFNKVRSFTENHKNTSIYQDELTVCSEQKLRLKDELADTQPLSITRDFAKDACDLPEIYDVIEYIHFLDKWGTSIVTEVLLGSSQLQRHQTTEPAVFNFVSQRNPGLLQHSGSYLGYATSLSLSRQDYVKTVARTSSLGSSVTTFDTHGGLVPVGLKLVPITFAFDWKFWKNRMGEFQAMGVCRDDMTMSSVKAIAENVNQTLHRYFDIKHNMHGIRVNPLTDTALQIPVTWPKGTYGLMKPTTGCPTSHVTWQEGWRVQDSRNLGVHNRFSPGISSTLAGTFDSRELQTKFCMKTDSAVTPYDRGWPAGNYCILKKIVCPSGFSSGSIYWDDRDFINKNKHGGTLPDGTYNRNTKIYYCCRDDGSVSNPITLPVDRAFVLIRYKGACQKVYNMDTREVFIQWDTANVGNDDEDKGAHPLDDGGKEHKLHFCYYYFNTGGVIVG